MSVYFGKTCLDGWYWMSLGMSNKVDLLGLFELVLILKSSADLNEILILI